MLDLQPQHDFLIGIDSDGCVFDTMELKHKECFIPCTIDHYELQAISKLARETWEFVNLYSKSRGINRFPALIETLKLLRRRQEVRKRGVQIHVPQRLAEWVQSEARLGNPALAVEAERTDADELKQALGWSEAVNASVEKIVRGVPPFPYVRECLKMLKDRADLLVVSATPGEALHREWEEHKLSGFVHSIRGQEIGTKKEMLSVAKRYASDRALMVGDAPGDYTAAQANSTLFFPIVPGREDESWQRFYEEGIERFFADTFTGAYQQQLLDDFNRSLPAEPPWPLEGP